jgi:glutamate racemase
MISAFIPSDLPVGVFDSGLGGLSVVRDIRRRLPNEELIYFADSAYCPYGIKTPEEIRARSETVVGELVRAGAKVIVVACNTASAMAIFALRDAFPHVPIIGLEPAVKPAVERTRTGVVGVLATPRTVAGERLEWLIETYAGGVEVYRVAATGLVELVEAGVLEGPDVDAALAPLLDPMVDVGVDQVVLGCTHYPFLRNAIQRYVGDDVAVIDSGEAIARRLEVVLTGNGLRRGSEVGGTFRMTTSGDPGAVAKVAAELLGTPVTMVESSANLHGMPFPAELMARARSHSAAQSDG